MKPTQQQLLLRNLRDAGCTDETIRQYFHLGEGGHIKEQLQLLARHRAALLDRLHQNQKEIDCLDYLIYQMEQKKSFGGNHHDHEL